MNADFHYYATYLAARLADYNKDDAKKIAYSAAFVDYFDYTTAICEGVIGNFTYSTQNVVEMLDAAVCRLPGIDGYNQYWPNYSFEIWAAFHFLPGNEDLSTKFTGATEDRERLNVDGWSFDKRCNETFKLLCKTNSNLGVKMINDIKDAKIEKEALLHLIGVRMHVLADTWAHQYFSATGQWFMNDTDKDVFEITDEGTDIRKIGWVRFQSINDWFEKIKYIIESDLSFKDNLFIATPAIAPFYHHVVETGHGRMGHLPDYSCMSYRYRPIWSKDYIKRDGVKMFTQALAQMAQALTCIKKGEEFHSDSYYTLEERLSNKEEYVRLLKTKKIDLSNEWLKIIKELFGFVEDIPAFDEEKWYSDFSYISSNTDLMYFNAAAKYHKEFVVNYLRTKQLYPNSSSNYEHTCFLKTVSPSDSYICQAESYEEGTYANFEPTLGKCKVPLAIVKQDSTLLKSGDIIEIKTLENTKSWNEYRAADKPFLSALESGHRIMYDTQGYRTNAQRWIIERPDQEDGTAIKSGDEVTIRNIFFDKKPYLNSVKRNGYKFLELTEESRKWKFEIPSQDVLNLFN